VIGAIHSINQEIRLRLPHPFWGQYALIALPLLSFSLDDIIHPEEHPSRLSREKPSERQRQGNGISVTSMAVFSVLI